MGLTKNLSKSWVFEYNVYILLYVTLEHKTSPKGQFSKIEMYASSES